MDDFKGFVQTGASVLETIENLETAIQTPEEFEMLTLSLDLLQDAAPNCRPLQEARSKVIKFSYKMFATQVVLPTEMHEEHWDFLQNKKDSISMGVIVHAEDIHKMLKRNLLGLHFGHSYVQFEELIERLVTATRHTQHARIWPHWQNQLRQNLIDGAY